MSGFIPSIVPEYFNVVDLHLDRWIREGLSNKIALIDLKSNEFVTYSELYTLTCKLANLLTDYSIEMFDKVMIAMRDSKFSVASFLAAMRAGAVPFFVNPNFTKEEPGYRLLSWSRRSYPTHPFWNAPLYRRTPMKV
jgi:acyl-coenzyme A synthetase/AMP-(fatty) acid ligase